MKIYKGIYGWCHPFSLSPVIYGCVVKDNLEEIKVLQKECLNDREGNFFDIEEVDIIPDNKKEN